MGGQEIIWNNRDLMGRERIGLKFEDGDVLEIKYLSE